MFVKPLIFHSSIEFEMFAAKVNNALSIDGLNGTPRWRVQQYLDRTAVSLSAQDLNRLIKIIEPVSRPSFWDHISVDLWPAGKAGPRAISDPRPPKGVGR